MPTLHEQRLGGKKWSKSISCVISSLPHCIQQILEKEQISNSWINCGVGGAGKRGHSTDFEII